MCSCIEVAYRLQQEQMAATWGPILQKNVIKAVGFSVLFTVGLLVYASKSSLFKVQIQMVTEDKPPVGSFLQPKYLQHEIQSDRKIKSAPTTTRDPDNLSNSSTEHNLDIGNDNVPKSLLYKPKTFLPNFRNPCWYEISEEYDNKILKCLPYFFLAGMPKCGTTDLYYMLTKHPVIELSQKEPHWWTRNRFRTPRGLEEKSVHHGIDTQPLDKYTKYYDKNTDNLQKYTIKKTLNSTVYHHHIVGDGSASTLWDMQYFVSHIGFNKSQPTFTTANIIKTLLPNVKIIVILRNPVDRLYSDYLYFTKAGDKSAEDFHNRAEHTVNQMNNCIFNFGRRWCAYKKNVAESKIKKVRLNIGMYSVFLEDWFKVFPENQIIVVRLEDYTLHRSEYLQRIARFLEIEPYPQSVLDQIEDEAIANQRKKKDKKVGQMLPQTRDMLEKFYQPFNEQLADFLKYEKYGKR